MYVSISLYEYKAFISITVVQFEGTNRTNEFDGSVSFTVVVLTSRFQRPFTVQVCTTDLSAEG